MPKPRRRTAVILATALVLVTAVAGVVVFVLANRPEPPPPAAAPTVRTTTVRKTDLANTRSVPGLLAFGEPRKIKGTGTGTVTKLPEVGAVAAVGKPLYWVDDRPVPVFFGGTPLFRKLETPGTKGSDVAVVVDNLARLGYKTGRRPADDTKVELTAQVVEALKTWQKRAGLEPTGTVDVGGLLVLDGPVRVASVQAHAGAAVTEELFTVTPNNRVVTMSLGADDAAALKTGTPVTVVRPDQKEVPAKIEAVTPAASGPDGPGDGTPKMNVVVVPAEAAAVADLDSAPVSVKITTESRSGVLVVPVEALIALQEGGYAVQLPGGELRAVKTGMYARNDVEITGSGVTEGLEVVTAS